MQTVDKDGRIPLRVQFLDQAYDHPRFAGIRFQQSKMCQSCGSEYVYVLREDEYGKLFACQNCGLHFKEKALAA